MSFSKLVICSIFSLALAGSPSFGADAAKSKVKVLQGPARANIGAHAHIEVPEGYSFLDGESTRAMMKESGEPVSGNEVGFILPTNETFSVFFEFDEIGYVKDDDKDKLDADKLLASIKKGTEAANKERARHGNSPIEIVGWEVPPKYDPETHNLEWAIRATSGGRPLLNYNTRLLGRKGVMEVVLVIEPDQLAATLPTFRSLLSTYSFDTGQTYAEYRKGDKVAKFGLAALVVGGAAVGAAKLGLFAWLIVAFKKFAKLIIIGVVAVAVMFRNMFRKLFGGRSSNPNVS